MPAWKIEPFSEANYSVDKDILHKLEQRLGPIHARQRLGIEKDHEAQVFGQGLTFFHLENLHLAPAIIRNALKLTGLYWRARRNAEHVTVRRNDLRFAALPSLFDGYTSVGAGSSVVPVRLNCPPEITLHCLRRG